MADSAAGRLFADVARVRLELGAEQSAPASPAGNAETYFGSGRLIGNNLVLTARHVLETRAGIALPDDGWEVRLVGDQVEPGRWIGEPLAARVVWRGAGGLDLALLELIGVEREAALADLRIGSYGSIENLPDCWVAGFPRAAREEPTRARPYGFPAELRTATPGGALRLTIDPSDSPKEALDWSGVSGGCVLAWWGEIVWLLGVVQHVPPAFGAGALDVSGLSSAWKDDCFVGLITARCPLAAAGIESLEQVIERERGQSENLQRLLQILSGNDPVAQTFAAERLGAPGLPVGEVMPALIAALDSGSESVRQSAAAALGRIGPAAMPALLAALKDPVAQVRVGAAEALGQVQPVSPATVPALTTALGDSAKQVRRAAAGAVGRIGAPAAAAVPALVAALDEADAKVRDHVIEALAAMGAAAAEAAPALAILRLENGIRSAAGLAFDRIGPAAVLALISALGEDKPRARQAAADALGYFGPAASPAVSALVALLGDAEDKVRQAAAHALGKIGPAASEAVPTLIVALSDPKGDVRSAAARALADIGSAAVPALIAIVHGSAGAVRVAAVEPLAGIGPAASAAPPALVVALSDADWFTRTRVAEALGEIGASAAAAVPQLRAALRDANSFVRQAAAKALGLIGPAAAEAVPELLAVLGRERGTWRIGWPKRISDPNWLARTAAVEALARIGLAAVPALLAAVNNSDRLVRDVAASGIERMGPAAAPALAAILRGAGFRRWTGRAATARRRAFAADLLGRIGPAVAETVQALTAALDDPSWRVRAAAGRSLARIRLETNA